MDDQMKACAARIRTGLRQTEGALDDVLLEATGLMEAMLRARQNPAVPPHAGQRSIVRLVHAIQLQVDSANEIFRIHDEMSQLGIVYGVLDRRDSTPLSGFDDNSITAKGQATEIA